MTGGRPQLSWAGLVLGCGEDGRDNERIIERFKHPIRQLGSVARQRLPLLRTPLTSVDFLDVITGNLAMAEETTRSSTGAEISFEP